MSDITQVTWSEETLREESSWSYRATTLAVTGLKSGFNSCDFQVNSKGAQLIWQDNPAPFHSLRISLCSLFNVCQAALPNNLLLPSDLDISVWLSVHLQFHSLSFLSFPISSSCLLLYPLAVSFSFNKTDYLPFFQCTPPHFLRPLFALSLFLNDFFTTSWEGGFGPPKKINFHH